MIVKRAGPLSTTFGSSIRDAVVPGSGIGDAPTLITVSVPLLQSGVDALQSDVGSQLDMEWKFARIVIVDVDTKQLSLFHKFSTRPVTVTGYAPWMGRLRNHRASVTTPAAPTLVLAVTTR